MTFTRIETASDLPPEGPLNDRAREKSDLDFKKFADPAKSWEHAKDIAAFSNALGGVLLVGAEDATGQLVYPGIAGQTVNEIKAIYEGAAQLCSPSPVVDVVPIPEKSLVAVNIEPYMDQLVAAPAKSRDRTGKEIIHSAAWVFPIRRASQTEFIKPENLAMYMNREVRRAVLLLAKIPETARREVPVHFHVHKTSTTEALSVSEMVLSLGQVSLEANFLELLQDHGGSVLSCRVPLTDVQDVWSSKKDRWSIRLAGRLGSAPTPSSTSPRLTYSLLPRRS
ncbi:MAG: hypothetical protein AMXMBFR56_53320 [Polyangiaceae bacterium]